jgi:predicted enzyme related to lactoylglutathione lyase
VITEIRSIPVIVSDLDEAISWYQEKLGFEVRERDGHWVTVAPEGWASEIHLCKMDELEPGNTGILLLADNLEDTCKELKENGVEFTQEPSKKAGGTIAKFKDLSGNVLWLMSKNEYEEEASSP